MTPSSTVPVDALMTLEAAARLQRLVENEDLTIEEVCSYAGMTKAMFERVYGHDAKQRADKIAKAQGKKRPRPRQEGRPSNLPPRDDDEDAGD